MLDVELVDDMLSLARDYRERQMRREKRARHTRFHFRTASPVSSRKGGQSLVLGISQLKQRAKNSSSASITLFCPLPGRRLP